MTVYKYLSPFIPGSKKTANRKTRFNNTLNKSGVYIIKENGKIVYIGHSTVDLYRTMYHHFSKWTQKAHGGRQQVRVTYVDKLKTNDYTVRVILCTPARAMRLEKMLIIKYKPRDNDVKYEAYKILSIDKNILNDYQEAPVERDAPF